MLRNLFALILLIVSITASSLSHADANFVNRHDVQDFIQLMVKKYKFNKQDLVYLFSQVKMRPQVIKHMNRPLEKNPWHTYQMLFVNEWRIEHGVKFWNKHADTLRRAEQVYGVPASIIVATIGIE